MLSSNTLAWAKCEQRLSLVREATIWKYKNTFSTKSRFKDVAQSINRWHTLLQSWMNL